MDKKKYCRPLIPFTLVKKPAADRSCVLIAPQKVILSACFKLHNVLPQIKRPIKNDNKKTLLNFFSFHEEQIGFSLIETKWFCFLWSFEKLVLHQKYESIWINTTNSLRLCFGLSNFRLCFEDSFGKTLSSSFPYYSIPSEIISKLLKL